MREYLKDKRNAYLFSTLLLLGVAVTFIFAYLLTLNKGFQRSRELHAEMSLLKDEFIPLKTRIDEAERKKKLSKISGIIPALDEVFSPLGLKNRIKSIKPVGTREISGGVEEAAEVSVEKLSMNETVNLLYRIENAPMLIVLKKADMKTSFDRPDLLNLSMTISIVHEK